MKVNIPRHTPRIKQALAVFHMMFAAFSCTTPGTKHTSDAPSLPPAPAITAETSTADLVSLGIDYGSNTLAQAKKQIKLRKASGEALSQITPLLRDSSDRLNDQQLLNASNLYGSVATALDGELFDRLVSSERLLARRVGWQLAASHPAPAVSARIDRILSQALLEDRLEQVLLPQMANAVRTSKLQSAYTILRQGLLSQGDEEYVLAMIALQPAQASEDFLSYLLLAPAEELRQLTLSSVKVYSVMAILRHMKNYPPQPGSLGFDHLFAYMISRNNGISELARGVIEQYLPRYASSLGIGLGKQPQWIQVAVLENIRREKTPGLLLLLYELKNTTSDPFIAKDIEAIQD